MPEKVDSNDRETLQFPRRSPARVAQIRTALPKKVDPLQPELRR